VEWFFLRFLSPWPAFRFQPMPAGAHDHWESDVACICAISAKGRAWRGPNGHRLVTAFPRGWPSRARHHGNGPRVFIWGVFRLWPGIPLSRSKLLVWCRRVGISPTLARCLFCHGVPVPRCFFLRPSFCLPGAKTGAGPIGTANANHHFLDLSSAWWVGAYCCGEERNPVAGDGGVGCGAASVVTGGQFR